MKIDKLIVGPIQTNCYIISSDKKNVILIDPGDEVEKLIEFTDINKLNLKYILLTHGHFDHLIALKELIDKYSEAKTYISEKGVALVKDIEEQLKYAGLDSSSQNKGKKAKDVNFDKYLKEGDIVVLDDLRVKTIETPGHTEGGISLLLNEKHLFTGDTLFNNGIGRTDLPGGNIEILRNSLKKLLKLSDNIKIYPGHGEDSTIGEERESLDLNSV